MNLIPNDMDLPVVTSVAGPHLSLPDEEEGSLFLLHHFWKAWKTIKLDQQILIVLTALLLLVAVITLLVLVT